jgi:glycosyltransferase involved in cell wall biosynthesis
MERDSSDMSSVSDDNKYPAVNLELNIKTLNPEQDLQIFIQEMNFKQSSIDIKYPKHLFKILKRMEKISNWMLLYNIDSESMIEILYNGVDIPKYDAVTIENIVENQIIFVGRLAPHKHVDHLITVLGNIRKTVPSVKLVIVGKGEEKENLVNLVNQNDLEDIITFKQDLSDEELIKKIKESEMLVLPSTREGFGMVLAEANCCYRPVVTYASGGTVEVVEDEYNGYLIESENVAELENKIIKLLNNKELQKQIGISGRKKVEAEFNWDAIVNSYVLLVETMIHNK